MKTICNSNSQIHPSFPFRAPGRANPPPVWRGVRAKQIPAHQTMQIRYTRIIKLSRACGNWKRANVTERRSDEHAPCLIPDFRRGGNVHQHFETE